MADEKEEKLVCGVVMPISSIDGCPESHWVEVYSIIKDAISDAGFTGCLVSESDDSGIIHKRIINNLYNNPLVVCDVSGKNPNVMFELGMRLAFDKPTIIIKDSHTSYSFDTSVIEHLEYPRDLRFKSIIDFKKKLSAKIKATFEASSDNENYTTFLKHFGEFKVAKIDSKEVSSETFILEELKLLKQAFMKLTNKNSYTSSEAPYKNDNHTFIKTYMFTSDASAKNCISMLSNYDFIIEHRISEGYISGIVLTLLLDISYVFSPLKDEFDSLLIEYGGALLPPKTNKAF